MKSRVAAPSLRFRYTTWGAGKALHPMVCLFYQRVRTRPGSARNESAAT